MPDAVSTHTLRIALKTIRPPIWRKVRLPSTLTLEHLHEVIQLVMGWQNDHLHHFVKQMPMPSPERLKNLNAWQARILKQNTVRYIGPKTDPMGFPLEMECEDESQVRIMEVLPLVKSKIRYDYDFGDDWRHDVIVQKIEDVPADEASPVCIGGKRACPMEDCGGPYRYDGILEILDDPAHDLHAEYQEWFGKNVDAEAWDQAHVNAGLKGWWKTVQV